MTCKRCGRDFTPYHGKPGYINECGECKPDVPLLGGNMIWDHKTAPELEIKPLTQAKTFAKLQRRFGVGVLSSITQSRESPHNPGMKRKSGAEGGAGFTTRLGEKRTVKN